MTVQNQEKLPCNVTLENATVTINGQPRIIHKSHKSYLPIRQAIKEENWAKVRELVAVADKIAAYGEGEIVVEGGTVTFNGEALHGLLIDHILEAQAEGLPFKKLTNLLKRLMGNPSYKARNEFYNFATAIGLTFDEDGYCYGYKAVTGDYKDMKTGKFDNSIGKEVSMPRAKCDDDGRRECSDGLHIGSLKYVLGNPIVDSEGKITGYQGGFLQAGGVALICKFDPTDVVSVPHADAEKMRVCRYWVHSHFVKPLSLGLVDTNLNSLYTGKKVDKCDDSMYYENDEEYFSDGWSDDPDCEDEPEIEDCYNTDDDEDWQEEDCGDPTCDICRPDRNKF